MPGRQPSHARDPPEFRSPHPEPGIIRDPACCRLCRYRHKRHTFAHDRLTAWYRAGADVQRLLPQLSTYLGHLSIAATQVYLTMTPELLREANLRFGRYADLEDHHAR